MGRLGEGNCPRLGTGAGTVKGGEPPPGIALMVVGGSRDQTTPYPGAVAVHEAAEAPRYLVGVEGAGHFSFSDICGVIDQPMMLEDGCGEGFRPSEEVHALTNRLVGPFLDLHLRGDARAAEALLPAAVAGELGEAVEYRADP